MVETFQIGHKQMGGYWINKCEMDKIRWKIKREWLSGKWKEALTVFCSSLDGGEIQKPIPGKNDFLNEQIQPNRMKTTHELPVLLMQWGKHYKTFGPFSSALDQSSALSCF